MATRLKFVKRVFYKLKRAYGLPIVYYQRVSHQTEPDDGDKHTEYLTFLVRRAVVLRAREFRSFVYDLAYISANKDFTTGAFFDVNDRVIVIDALDVSDTFRPTNDDYIIFQNQKFEVKEIEHFENNYGWMCLVRHVRGAPVTRVEESISVMDLQQLSTSIIKDKLERIVTSTLTLGQSAFEVV